MALLMMRCVQRSGIASLDLQHSACEFIGVNLIFHLALLITNKPQFALHRQWVFQACYPDNLMDIISTHFRK